MQLLKTHSHTSERPGCEGRKSAEKEIERNAVNIIRPPVKNLPRTASVAGTRDEKGVMARQTTVKTLPRTVSAAGGGETKKSGLKENTGAKTRETKIKTLPQATIVAGERDKRRKPTRNGKVAQPTDPRGGQVPSRKRIAKRKESNVHYEQKKTKHAVLCHCVSSQITLAAPRLGTEEGVGRTTRKKNTKNPLSRASV